MKKFIFAGLLALFVMSCNGVCSNSPVGDSVSTDSTLTSTSPVGDSISADSVVVDSAAVVLK